MIRTWFVVHLTISLLLQQGNCLEGDFIEDGLKYLSKIHDKSKKEVGYDVADMLRIRHVVVADQTLWNTKMIVEAEKHSGYFNGTAENLIAFGVIIGKNDDYNDCLLKHQRKASKALDKLRQEFNTAYVNLKNLTVPAFEERIVKMKLIHASLPYMKEIYGKTMKKCETVDCVEDVKKEVSDSFERVKKLAKDQLEMPQNALQGFLDNIKIRFADIANQMREAAKVAVSSMQELC